jgi:uncharacterized protein YjbI with pentapeptide repeats
VVTRLISGRDLGSLDLSENYGRVDLRDLPASGMHMGGQAKIVELRSCRLEALDLSGARLGSWRLYDCVLDNCRLDGADCQDWRLWRSSVTGCSFTNAGLRGAAVGTCDDGTGNTWRDVDFSRSDFRVGVSWAAQYEHCDFRDADLTDVRFEQCSFTRCIFGGELRNVLFDGRAVSGRPPSPPLAEVDFRSARFDNVVFLGFDLTQAALPNDPDLRIVHRYQCSLERALALLAEQDSAPARVVRADFESRARLLRAVWTQADMGLLNRRDFLTYGGEAAADLADDILRRSEAACLGDGPST